VALFLPPAHPPHLNLPLGLPSGTYIKLQFWPFPPQKFIYFSIFILLVIDNKKAHRCNGLYCDNTSPIKFHPRVPKFMELEQAHRYVDAINLFCLVNVIKVV
jgi:hypothetical protein